MCCQVHCLISHQGICWFVVPEVGYPRFGLQGGMGLGAATPAGGSPQPAALVGTELGCPRIPALCLTSLLALGKGQDVFLLAGLPASPSCAGCHGTVLPKGCWHRLALLQQDHRGSQLTRLPVSCCGC